MNKEESENDNTATGGAEVEFVGTKEKGDASPFPGSGFVAPANTPVAPMFAASGSGGAAAAAPGAEVIKPADVPKPVQVPKEHQQAPSLESADMSALIQAVTGDVNVAQLTQQINALHLEQQQHGQGEEGDAEEDEEMEREAKLLEPVQKELDKLEEIYAKERLALELKFQELYKPLYEMRRAVVNGETPSVAAAAAEGGAEEAEEEEEEEEHKGVNAFWLSVMTYIKAIGEFITEADEEALEHLRDIKLSLIDPSVGTQKMGYRLDFEFDENPFFTNKVLTKTLEVPKLFTLGDLQFGKVYGTEIDWKSPEKNLCAATTDEGAAESFFQFFDVKTANFPISSDSEGDQNLPELTEEQYFAIQRDYAIAEALRTKAIPDAIKWYTGECFEEEDEEEGEGEGEEEEGDDEDEDDDDDEEEEDDDEGHGHSHRGRRHNHGHTHAHGAHGHSHGGDDHGGSIPQFTFPGGTQQQGTPNAECKQQ